MVNFEVKDDRFEIYREQYARSYQNFEKEQPYQHAMYHQVCMGFELAKFVCVLRLAAHLRLHSRVNLDSLIRPLELRTLSRAYACSRAPSAHSRQSLMLESDRHHRLDKIAAVVSVTPAELRAHLPELLRSLFVDILAHGNMTAAQATEFARALQVCFWRALRSATFWSNLHTRSQLFQFVDASFINGRLI